MNLDLQTLGAAVAEHAAFRRRQRLQPIGGKGDKIFPPTYPGEGKNAPPRHVFERRRSDVGETWCVLVDSVQSQANRLEETLLGAVSDGVPIPRVVVDFSDAGLAGVTQVSSLDAPHRIYDAILRDSLLDGSPFLSAENPTGKKLLQASTADATAVLEVSPNALLFGSWNSTGQGGGLGAKFARCLTAEIVAVDVPVHEVVDRRTGEVFVQTASRRTSSRIDPLGVVSKVSVFKGGDGWDVSKDGAGKGAQEARPSEINHGNIRPSVDALGVTCDHLEHTFVLSFAALRRLRFGNDDGRAAAARRWLAALGLLALVEQDARGYALRSRCDLVCDGVTPIELVHADGSVEPLPLERAQVRQLYEGAFRAAADAGFTLRPEPLILTPQKKLVEIVRKSQELALRGAGEGADEDGSDS